MPKYANSNSIDVTIDQYRIPAKETLETTAELTTPLPSGVTKVSALPSFNNVIESETVGGNAADPDKEYSLNVSDGNKTIDIFCAAGEIDVYINDKTNAPAYVIPAGFGEKIGDYALGQSISKVIIDWKVDGSLAKVEIRKV